MSFAEPRSVEARWCPVEGVGLEHLAVSTGVGEIVARGVVIGGRGRTSYGVDYTLVCDGGWHVRELHLGTAAGMALSLLSDGAGRWTNHDGKPLPDLDGCLDVDLAGTPFTNTLPVRRVDWAVQGGAPLELTMLYVPFDSFVPARDGKIYTALGGRRFRLQAADGSFEAELTVDDDGLVTEYPGLFTRLP